MKKQEDKRSEALMFDPTAFDNLKVVLEGAIYDLDLSGDIRVLERKDLVDLATMSRRYEIKFALRNHTLSSLYTKMTLEATMEQLAAELMEKSGFQQPGAYVSIDFGWDNEHNINMEKVKELWGENRTYDEKKVISSQHGTRMIVSIDFHRFITEDMIDDVIAMIRHMVKTLYELDKRGHI